ncbi:MAG: hypothetical protein ACRDY3_09755 [Acidimicrobiales bacterium]
MTVPGPGPGEPGAAGVDLPPVEVLMLCTGNATRSVMAGAMLAYLADAAGTPLRVSTAGTHAVDGMPVSWRTRSGLAAVGALEGVSLSRHRSRQLVGADLRRATLVVAMEAAHVRYVRRTHPGAAARTATLRRLCRDLPPGPGGLAGRVAALGLAEVDLAGDQDVADPAGLEEEDYVACALELWTLCQELAARL